MTETRQQNHLFETSDGARTNDDGRSRFRDPSDRGEFVGGPMVEKGEKLASASGGNALEGGSAFPGPRFRAGFEWGGGSTRNAWVASGGCFFPGLLGRLAGVDQQGRGEVEANKDSKRKQSAEKCSCEHFEKLSIFTQSAQVKKRDREEIVSPHCRNFSSGVAGTKHATVRKMLRPTASIFILFPREKTSTVPAATHENRRVSYRGFPSGPFCHQM